MDRDIAGGTMVPLPGGWKTISLPIPTLHSTRRLVPQRVAALIGAVAGQK